MRVVLAGASGTLGRALLPRLRAAGHEIIGITRSPDAAARLRMQGVEPVVADALDRDALLRAVEGIEADAVLHQLTALSRAPLRYSSMNATNELRTRGTANLVDLARAVGAARMLTQSIVFGYGYRRSLPVALDESAPFGSAEGVGVDDVHAALVENERRVLDAAGIDGIALRYGLFYGLDAVAVKGLLTKRSLPVSKHEGVIPLLHHEDAAAATVLALEHGVAGRAYNIADDRPVSWRRYVESAARAFGTPAPLVVPSWILRAAIPYAAELMTRMDLRISSALARAELGWAPEYASVEEGWVASARHPDGTVHPT